METLSGLLVLCEENPHGSGDYSHINPVKSSWWSAALPVIWDDMAHLWYHCYVSTRHQFYSHRIVHAHKSWWRHQMEFTGPAEFPTQRPVTRSFDVLFDLRLTKRLSKQPWGWWFETPSWSLWRQCNVVTSSLKHDSPTSHLSTQGCFRFAPNQWETVLPCNNVSHWLGAGLESALPLHVVDIYYRERNSLLWRLDINSWF